MEILTSLEKIIGEDLMISEKLVVNPRSKNLTARQLRRKGYVPGVVYGSGDRAIPIEIDAKALSRMIKKIGQGVMFEIAMENELDTVRIKDLQKDPVTNQIIHIDMHKVEANKIVEAEVPLRFEGTENFGKYGAAIQYQKDTVKVQGYAKDIPSFIRVNIKDIGLRDKLHVYDLEIAEELTIIDDMDQIIFTAVKSKEKENVEEQDQEDIRGETEVQSE